MHVPMLAVKISRKTYPLVIACADPRVCYRSFEDIRGEYLVINVLQPFASQAEWENTVGFVNLVLDKDDFNLRYYFTGEEVKDVLCPVEVLPERFYQERIAVAKTKKQVRYSYSSAQRRRY